MTGLSVRRGLSYGVATNVATRPKHIKAVGVRELKLRTSEILRQVREGREAVDVTYRGRVVARIVPSDDPHHRLTPAQRRQQRRVWTDIDRLARELGRRWPKNVSAAEAVSEQRRG